MLFFLFCFVLRGSVVVVVELRAFTCFIIHMALQTSLLCFHFNAKETVVVDFRNLSHKGYLPSRPDLRFKPVLSSHSRNKVKWPLNDQF